MINSQRIKIKVSQKGENKKRQSPYVNIDWDKASQLFKQPLKYKDNKLYPAVRELLHILAAAGAIGISFAFPKAGATIGSLLLKDTQYQGWRINQITNQLIDRKFIEIVYNNDNTITVIITKNGMVRALKYQLDSMEIHKPRRWDKKWRVIIFDIPEKYKKIREIFRNRLQQLNLYQLQESVYVYPYPCFDEIEFLRELYGIPSKVLYLLVDKIEDDEFLKNRFDLG